MALKWMWGFEIGADETFYSGSGWTINRYQTAPTGASFFNGALQTNKTDDVLYDYRSNFPHQPTSSVGGGYYSLKVNPAAYYQSVYDAAEVGLQNLWMSVQPMSIMTPQLGETNTANISFSMHSDLDVVQWPFTVSSGFKFAERFLALYPQETTTSPLVVTGSGYAFGFPQTASGDIPNNLPTLPPQISLFLHATGSTPGTIESRIVAVCTTGSLFSDDPFGAFAAGLHAGAFYGDPDSVPENTRYSNYFQLAIMAGVVATSAGDPSYPQGQNGFFIYTSSAGNYLPQNEWTEVTVQYIPHKTNGAIRVYLDGVNVINVEGVPTAYTSSYDWDTGNTVSQGLTNTGRIEFSSSPFSAFPGPNSGLVGYSSSIEPATFFYDHVCLFDEASDLSTATASIFIQGLKPTSDVSIGNFTGDDSSVANLYNYIDDPNESMETSFMMGAPSTAASFELQTVNIIEEGAKLWDLSTIQNFVGVGVINAYENIGAATITVNSSMFESSEALGPNYTVQPTDKQMSLFVSGSDPGGSDWVLATINNLKGGIKIS